MSMIPPEIVPVNKKAGRPKKNDGYVFLDTVDDLPARVKDPNNSWSRGRNQYRQAWVKMLEEAQGVGSILEDADISEEFRKASLFAKWLWRNNGPEGVVSAVVPVPGNKHYGPDTVTLIPPHIDTLIRGEGHFTTNEGVKRVVKFRLGDKLKGGGPRLHYVGKFHGKAAGQHEDKKIAEAITKKRIELFERYRDIAKAKGDTRLAEGLDRWATVYAVGYNFDTVGDFEKKYVKDGAWPALSVLKAQKAAQQAQQAQQASV